MGSFASAAWLVFGAVVAALLAVDLCVIGRAPHGLTAPVARRWTVIVVAVALLFGLLVLGLGGAQRGLEYYAGYLIELSLSVDNLFVFLLIFRYFAVPLESQPRVLMWGIMTAIVLRGIMIAGGVAAIERFHWLIYVLGGVLLITSLRMLKAGDVRIEPERNPLVRLARRFVPVTDHYERQAFIVRRAGRLFVTPLVLVLIVIEWSDVVFAIDSIPAIFAVTRDPFVIFSSNIFAVMGLRAMFFVLADLMQRFAYLKPGVAIILGFVGLKMLVSGWFHLPILISLGVIIGVLAISVALSVAKLKRQRDLVTPPPVL